MVPCHVMFRVYTMYRWYHHLIHVTQGIHHVSVMLVPCHSCSGYTPCISGITCNSCDRVYTMYQWYYHVSCQGIHHVSVVSPCSGFTMYQCCNSVQGIHHVSVILPCHSVQGIHHVSVVSPCSGYCIMIFKDLGYTPCIHVIHVQGILSVILPCHSCSGYTPCISDITMSSWFRVYTMYQWYHHVIHVQGIHHVSVILPCHSCSGYTPCISVTMPLIRVSPCIQWYYHVIHVQGIHHVSVILPCHSCSGYTPCISDIHVIHVQGIHHVSVISPCHSPCNSCSGYTPCISGITMYVHIHHVQWYHHVIHMYQWYYHVIHVQGIHHVSVALPHIFLKYLLRWGRNLRSFAKPKKKTLGKVDSTESGRIRSNRHFNYFFSRYNYGKVMCGRWAVIDHLNVTHLCMMLVMYTQWRTHNTTSDI